MQNAIKNPDANYTPMNTLFLTKKLKLCGKKKASSTNGAGITECQHVKDCKYIHIYAHAQNSSANGSKTLI